MTGNALPTAAAEPGGTMAGEWIYSRPTILVAPAGRHQSRRKMTTSTRSTSTTATISSP